jgi:hypothetical protein
MAILLAFACKGRPGRGPEQGPGKDSAVALVKDSAGPLETELLNSDSGSQSPPKYKGPYTEHQVLKIGNITVRVISCYRFSEADEDYRFGHFLILREADKKVADIIELEADDDDMSDVKIEDMSDSLKFKSLVLKLNSFGHSDIECDEFIEYRGDSLRKLFGLNYLRKIFRKDENTLMAIVQGRDDILYWGYDYPVTINLLDNSETGNMPDTQVIKHPTTTLEPITVYKLRGEQLSVPHKIKTGTPIFIDTFFRQSGLVRILLRDSTPVFIWKNDLTEKVEANTAG